MLEYHVGDQVYTSGADAAATAVASCISGRPYVDIDVVVYSEEDAREYSGELGADLYRVDPEASVFDRIRVRAESLGRVS